MDEFIISATVLSNLVGLIVFTLDVRPADLVLVAITMIASMLMHISETKHGLNGIYPFNKLSNLFLNIDRSIASVFKKDFGRVHYYKCYQQWRLVVYSFRKDFQKQKVNSLRRMAFGTFLLTSSCTLFSKHKKRINPNCLFEILTIDSPWRIFSS